MRRTERLEEIRKMRFEEVYGGWHRKKLSQEEAAMIWAQKFNAGLV